MSLAQQHRASQIALRATMLQSLIALWPTLRAESLDRTFPTWALSVGQLVISRRAVSAGLAKQYLQAERFASGVPGAPTLVDAGQADPQQIAASLRVTSLVAVKQSMLAGQPVPQAMSNAFVQSSGAATRLALDGGRETVVQSMLADPHVTRFRRITSANPCAFCTLLAGRGFVYLSAETAGENNRYHDHCVVGSTAVGGPTAEAAYRRWYEGELVIVGLADGEELAVTPNHPVLTDRGWIDAGLLREGDDVVQRTGADLASLHVPHENDVPARIEDVWRARRVDGLASMPVAAEDFHGDGAGTKGQVEVVASDGFLAYMQDARLKQLLVEPVSAGAGASAVLASLLGFGDPFGVLLGVGSSPSSVTSRSGLCGQHARVGLSEVGAGSLKDAAAFDPSCIEPTGYNVPRDAVLVGESFLGRTANIGSYESFGAGEASGVRSFGPGSRFDPPSAKTTTERVRVNADYGRGLLKRLSGGVQLGSVRELRRVGYSGHVYNLRTAEGWYSANGVVVSNCSCVIAPEYT